MDYIKTITYDMIEELYYPFMRCVESEYQKHEGKFSKRMSKIEAIELITELLLNKAVKLMIEEYVKDFPPEQPKGLLQ